VQTLGRIRDFIDFIKDAFWITRLALSSPWIWLCVGFGLFIIIQPLLLLTYPVAVLIVPAILIVYLLMSEDKRLAAQYGLKKKEGVTTAGAVKWDVKRSVEEYMQILNKRVMVDDARKKDAE
jgi:hypothetical protein